MEMKKLIDDYVFGKVLPEDIPDLAVEAIVDGYDSPSLRRLSGARGCDSEEIRSLLIKALHELELPLPSEEEAALSFAERIASEVLKGNVAPYEGARNIWHEIYVKFPMISQLRVFVGLASEYEDDIKNRASYESQIMEECEMFIQHSSGTHPTSRQPES